MILTKISTELLFNLFRHLQYYGIQRLIRHSNTFK
uniref:Uncharacterized protein n=1 Tax=Anguilla anguilla TaxID=7936 RepID=A0A0E9PVV4_ANGAN